MKIKFSLIIIAPLLFLCLLTYSQKETFHTCMASDIINVSWGYINGCPCWDSDLGNEFRQNFDTEIPSVIVQGTWDRSTPYENALELVPYFKNSKFIPLKWGPHSAIKAAMAESVEFKKAKLKFAASGDWSALPDQMELPPVKWLVPENK
jgi:TAP-like protein